MTTRVRSNSGEGIQLRLMGGSVYLRNGEETTLTDVQLTHNSIKNFLKRGVLVVVPDEKAETVLATPPYAEPVKAEKPKTPRTKASPAPVPAPEVVKDPEPVAQETVESTEPAAE